MKQQPSVNYGFLPPVEKPTDRLFGTSETRFNIFGIEDWTPYYSPGELQVINNVRTQACVSFSAIKIVSAIFNYKLEHNQISDSNLKWLIEKGYIVNGKMDASERYLAKMSGTSVQGNSADAVGNTVRHWGLVPQSVWPFDLDFWSWDEYYKLIPKEVMELGLEFAERFDISYDRVWLDNKEVVLEALSHSPLQVFVHAWDSPFQGKYQRTLKDINHAVSLPKPEWFIFDSFLDPKDGDFIKELVPDFLFYPTAFIYNVTEKNMTNVKIIKDADSPAVGFWLPQISAEAFKSNCATFGLPCPLKDDGSVDWDAVQIQGTLNLNQ